MSIKIPKSLPGFENVTTLNKKTIGKIPEFILRMKNHYIDKPVMSVKIEKGLGLGDRNVRAIVNYLRSKGFPIASNRKGYYIARNEPELKTTKQHMYGRIEGTMRAINGLEDPDFNNFSVERLGW